jgi:DNA-binding response OmpR family regulator
MSPDSAALLHTLLQRASNALSSAASDVAQAVALLSLQPQGPPAGMRSRLTGLTSEERFSVLWKGAECSLGPTLSFRLFCRLARTPGRAVTVEDLLDDVWGGRRSEPTVRSAVRQLRARLRQGGMADLADAIRRLPGHYVLRVPQEERSDESHSDRTEIAPGSHSSVAPSPAPRSKPTAPRPPLT